MAEPVHFADRLLGAIDRAGAPACVGLDPVLERIPAGVRSRSRSDAEAIEFFCEGVLDAIEGVVGVVKPQSACFERLGHEGMAVLERIATRARGAGMVVILDAKRGDIGSTAEHYASWAFETVGADAATVSPYLGFDTLWPFLETADRCAREGRGRGVFALVRTSNPGSDALQSLALQRGGTVAEAVAAGVRELGSKRLGERGYSDVGAVVAATKPGDARAMREAMPEQVFLVPGFGAQGGTAETVRALFKGGTGAVVNSSRGVIYAGGEGEWPGSVREAAEALARETRAAAS